MAIYLFYINNKSNVFERFSPLKPIFFLLQQQTFESNFL